VPRSSIEFIGYHLERSHRLLTDLGHRDERTRDVGRRAFQHLAAAGLRAFQRSDMSAAANLLGRASDLLDPADPERVRLGWRLGFALLESGAMNASLDVLESTRVRAQRAGNDVSAGYAECMRWQGLLLTNPDLDIDEWEASSDRLIRFFEGIDDQLGAALAWRQKSFALWLRQRIAESGAAAERAIAYAEAVGDSYIESDMRGHFLATVGLGPRPLDEARELFAIALADARARGQRRLEQTVLKGMGAHAAFDGRLEEARSLVEESLAIQLELGLMIEYWAGSQLTARIARWAGDVDEASRVLTEGCEQLEALGETAFLSTCATNLSEVEALRGDRASAQRWLEVAERTAAAGDRASQVGIHLCRGLLVEEGDVDAAESHFAQALELIDETDSPFWRSEARLTAAKALRATRPARARALAGEVLELSEAKGLHVLVDEVRSLLSEIDSIA
jgi:tetratricopeptide (TPR) repeat protein